MRKFFRTLLYIFALNSIQAAYSQSLRQPLSARYAGLGAYSVHHVDVFSFKSNQAALAQVKSMAGGVYAEKRFLLSAASMYTAIFALPTKEGNFGIQVDHFGFTGYNESQLGLAYARSLGNKVDVGIKFNYYTFKIPAYTGYSALNFEMGLITHLSDKLNAGVHVSNPSVGKADKKEDEGPGSAYTFGLGYEASQSFFVSGEIIKEEDKPVNVTVGFQYNFLKQLFVRAGIATETTNSYAGAGVSWKNFRLDVSGSYHPQLGFTPGLLLIINSKAR